MLERFTQRFTTRAREAVRQAVLVADGRGDGGDRGDVVPADLLAAILSDSDGLAVRVLAACGVDRVGLHEELERRRGAYVGGLGEEDAEALAAIGIDLEAVLRRLDRPRLSRRRRWWEGRFTPGAKKALELSLREAIALRHNYIGTEHLLLALARGGDPVVVDSLTSCGTTYAALRDGVREALRPAG